MGAFQNVPCPTSRQHGKRVKGRIHRVTESLATVDIDASKGFVNLWVHLSFAIFAIFDGKRELKLLEMACDQVQTCLIFPLRWACFPIEISGNAQWEHFDGFQRFFQYLPYF